MALAIDSQEASGTAHHGTTSPTTWSFTNTAGNLLIVGITISFATGTVAEPSAVTYNGVSMTKLTDVSWGPNPNAFASMWYLTSPATGANTVSITWTTSGGTTPTVSAGAISFSGADTSTPFGTPVTNTDGGAGAGNHATAGNVTGSSGNYILGVGGWGGGSGGNATPDAGQTATFQLATSGGNYSDNVIAVYQQSSGAAINLGYTWTGNDGWGVVAVEVRGASVAALNIFRIN